MKNSAKLFMCLTFFFAMGMSVYGQNVQKEVENMYERRAQKAEAERLVAEQIQAQIRKQAEDRQARLQQTWERVVKDGAKRFDRKRVEEAVRPFVSLNELLDSIRLPLEITDPKAVLSKGSAGVDSSLAGAPQMRFSQTKIPQPQNYQEIRFLPDPLYNIAYMVDRVWTVKELNGADEEIWKHFEKRKIHKGPLLLVKKPDGDCVVVDSGYKAFDKAKCDDYSYMPTVESRKKALRDLGFSENTVQKYAVKNPWNLETFVACDKFKEKSTFLVPTKQPNEYVRHGDHNLVERAVVAWRYATFTERNTNQKQYRYVFIQKDGQEREEKPQTDWEIPQCLDVDGKSRESVYKSITQAEPPSYSYVQRQSSGHPNWTGGIDIDIEYRIFFANKEFMLSADEEWGF